MASMLLQPNSAFNQKASRWQSQLFTLPRQMFRRQKLRTLYASVASAEDHEQEENRCCQTARPAIVDVNDEVTSLPARPNLILMCPASHVDRLRDYIPEVVDCRIIPCLPRWLMPVKTKRLLLLDCNDPQAALSQLVANDDVVRVLHKAYLVDNCAPTFRSLPEAASHLAAELRGCPGYLKASCSAFVGARPPSGSRVLFSTWKY
eukprot:gnl/TRDRNA2_/TRDRNA2_154026_c1_seq2.p1 gnl/TRDRNA2_/TRDRNA2_154026_c1~~gnl/TRDRNA2_/TRDRNA2_154026_c1_seq2.p1  ORF type:complete len:205 (-),score=21.51 gnl/TRDRNA2_/TRDRNA2_154026_c1_seq2:105-719(-)